MVLFGGYISNSIPIDEASKTQFKTDWLEIGSVECIKGQEQAVFSGASLLIRLFLTTIKLPLNCSHIFKKSRMLSYDRNWLKGAMNEVTQ